MFDGIMGSVRGDGFVIKEIITDKDSSMNAIFCRHYPEGTITYCSNHCAKTMHKDVEKSFILVQGRQLQVQEDARGISGALQSCPEQPDLLG